MKGRPIRFIKGHNNRLRTGGLNPRWLQEGATIAAIHDVLRRTFPKTGICEECGEKVGEPECPGTHFAFKFHGIKRHTRVRDDYRELCPACHIRFDRPLLEAGRRRGRRGSPRPSLS